MNNTSMGIVGAIILAGLIIGGAIIYTKGPTGPQVAGPDTKEPTTEPIQPSKNIPSIKSDDHVLGNPDAELTLIEYSDIECPFCKKFHGTMKQVMDTYGKDGKIKWVYRHFPLEMLHPTAPKEAEATECAAELGGEEKFWEFLDDLIANQIDASDIDNGLSKVAVKVGLDKDKFEECLKSGRHKNKIQDGMNEAAAAGVGGTPFSIIITKDGMRREIPGALPFAEVEKLINELLAL